MILITSEQNDHFRRWRGLDTSKAIRKAGEFILMGEKLVEEYLNEDPRGALRSRFPLRAELCPPGVSPRVSRLPEDLPRPLICELSDGLFQAVDHLGTRSRLLVLALPNLPAFEPRTPPKGLELVCPVGDPGNLGGIVRSAAAFDVALMILTSESCLPFHPKALKASAGASLRMSFAEFSRSLTAWPTSDQEWALDMSGESVSNFPHPPNLRLILGEEGPGLPEELSSLPRLSVPTSNRVESLNVGVATGIALYTLSKAGSLSGNLTPRKP